MSQKSKETKELDVKLGSPDMAFWQEIINAREIDVEAAKRNLRYFEFILKHAKEEFEIAEKEYNSKS